MPVNKFIHPNEMEYAFEVACFRSLNPSDYITGHQMKKKIFQPTITSNINEFKNCKIFLASFEHM